MSLPNDQDYISAILRRLASLETHIINMIVPMQSINDALKNPEHIRKLVDILGKPLIVDDRSVKRLFNDFQDAMHEFRKDLSKLDVKQTFDEIKFIGSRLTLIEKDIAEMKKDGMAKDIRLDFTVDGYQLVKKPIGYEKEEPIEDPNQALKELLSGLPSRCAKVITHSLGLLGEKKLTLKDTSILLGISYQQTRLIHAKALRMLRHTSRRSLVEKCNNIRLKAAVGLAD